MTRYLHLELRMNSPVELPVNGAEHVFHIFCENLCWLPKNWNINGNTWRVSELVANTDNSNNFFKSPAKAKFYKDNSFSLQYPEHYSSTLYWLTSADAERTKKKKKRSGDGWIIALSSGSYAGHEEPVRTAEGGTERRVETKHRALQRRGLVPTRPRGLRKTAVTKESSADGDPVLWRFFLKSDLNCRSVPILTVSWVKPGSRKQIKRYLAIFVKTSIYFRQRHRHFRKAFEGALELNRC